MSLKIVKRSKETRKRLSELSDEDLIRLHNYFQIGPEIPVNKKLSDARWSDLSVDLLVIDEPELIQGLDAIRKTKK